MKATGVVRDSVTKVPIAGAKVVMAIGDREIAVLFTDKEGRFEHRVETEYVGQTLNCIVTTDGYEPHDLVQDILQDDIQLNIELIREHTQLDLTIRDAQQNLLEGVKVTLKFNGEQVGVWVSDRHGLIKPALNSDFEGKTIQFGAEFAGFEVVEGDIHLQKETAHAITMRQEAAPIEPRPKRPPPSDKKWPKIAAAIFGLILVTIVIYLVIPKPSPKIVFFNSKPAEIMKGHVSTLKWRVEHAQEVTLNGEPVKLSGSTLITLEKTMRYTLIARNKKGQEDMKSVVVTVLSGIPSVKLGMGRPELNVDRPGMDYRDFDLPRNDPNLCKEECARDPRCKAWTYVKPDTMQGPEPRCWLKYAIPPTRSNTCCVSGIKLSEDGRR